VSGNMEFVGICLHCSLLQYLDLSQVIGTDITPANLTLSLPSLICHWYWGTSD